MDNMITFEVDVAYLVLRNQLEVFDFLRFGKHISKVSRMVVYPIITVIVTYQFAFLDIHAGIRLNVTGVKIVRIYSGSCQNHPFIL